MAPIKVRFGTTDYEIKLLRTNPQRKWREKLVAFYGEIVGNFSLSAVNLEVGVFKGGLIAALIKSPEKLAGLLFEYAPDLPRDTILDESTEEQIVHAFQEVLEVAFPFVAVLKMTTEILNSELSSSLKPASSN